MASLIRRLKAWLVRRRRMTIYAPVGFHINVHFD